MLAVAGAILLAFSGGLTLSDATGWALVLATAAFGIFAYFALTVAMRTGEVSAVTPFRYTRLVFAMILGILVFGERPDALTIVGSALVVGAGLYALARGRRVA